MSDVSSLQFSKAAVLIPIFERQGDLYVLLTKRSEKVRHHKGQICFPGGAWEQDDASLWQTALRETEEELGIHPTKISYIIELPRLNTPSLFEVTPFIGFMPHQETLSPNPDEIASVIEVPIKHLRNRDNLRFEEREHFGQQLQIPFFSYNEHEIWGATGRMLINLFDIW